MNLFKKIDKISRFEKVSTNITNEADKRKAEESILTPEPLKGYTGRLPKHKCALDKRVVRIVFPSLKSMDTVGKVLHIATSSKGIQYITDISILIEFCTRLVEDPEFAAEFAHVQKADAINIEAIQDSTEDDLDISDEDEE